MLGTLKMPTDAAEARLTDSPSPFKMWFMAKRDITPTFLELQRDLFLGQDADEFINEVLFPLSEGEGERLKKHQAALGIHGAIREILEEESDEGTLDFYAKLLQEKALDLAEVDPTPYESNPYARLLASAKKATKGDVRFEFEEIPAFRFFLRGEKRCREGSFLDVSPLGYFPRPFRTPVIKKKGRTWMSLVPHEIETMAPSLEHMAGRVAILGLGLGYYAFMASEKAEVERVEVYEKDPNILSFFKETLLPLFPNRRKIVLRFEDAFAYVDNGPYDAVFADLWHNADDGLPLYLKLKAIEKDDAPVDYWIEETILAYARRFLIHFLYGQGEIDRLLKELPMREAKILLAMRWKLGKAKDSEILALFPRDALIRFLAELSK